MNPMIKTNWATIQNKTANDFFLLALAKATKSKQNDKFSLFKELLKTQFTAVTNKNKLENGFSAWQTVEGCLYWATHYGLASEIFAGFSDDEKATAKELMQNLTDSLKTEKKYCRRTLTAALEDTTYVYFFTRQDISQEQQLVQTAHAAACSARDHNYDPHQQHFIVFGVPNKETLEARLNWLTSKCIEISCFYEPDPIWTEKTRQDKVAASGISSEMVSDLTSRVKAEPMGLSSFATQPIKKSLAVKKKLFENDSLLCFPKVTACKCD